MKKLFLATIGTILLSSCAHNNGWTVKGTIENANDGDKLALLGFNAAAGSWYLIDSIDLSQSGSFTYTAAQPSPYSDVYSLAYGDRNIFFPIDSIETITVSADAVHFDRGFRISGTPLADAMHEVDNRIQQSVDLWGINGVHTDSLLKRELTEKILEDHNGLIAYYIISKMVGGHPIFDVRNSKDLRTVGAVANNFMVNRPDDPRTAFLEKLYIDNRPKSNGSGKSIEANEVALFDISLYDSKGNLHSLIDEALKGNVVILSFVNYGVDITTPYNVKLNEAYSALQDRGVSVYQVSVGDNEMVWKSSAKNLPWTSVFNPSTDNEVLTNYNVRVVPTTYIINRNGELCDRVDDLSTLSTTVSKYL